MTRTAFPATVTYQLFPSPETILAEMPLPPAAAAGVAGSRAELRAILNGADDRLLVITGPCSVHDPEAALEYAERLADADLADDLLIVMRAYFEKPRTVTGWTGLLCDPGLDGSFDVHRGLREARRLIADIAMLGLPVACEFLNPVAPHYFSDAVTWGAVGARTTESQIHRQLASSLPMPVGFKNASDGDVQVAAEACQAAAAGPVRTTSRRPWPAHWIPSRPPGCRAAWSSTPATATAARVTAARKPSPSRSPGRSAPGNAGLPG